MTNNKSSVSRRTKFKTQMEKPIVDRKKLYEPLEAIKLAQSSSHTKFEGKIEAHFNLKKTGKFGAWKTEKKAPLLHTVLGKQSEKPEELVKKLAEIVAKVDTHQIKKLVICSTMGPGIKVNTAEFEK